MLARLILTIPTQMDRVADVGARVRAFCAGTPLDEVAAMEIELCVVEALNNAIEHGYGSRDDGEIRISAVRSLASLSVEVMDAGKPIPHDVLEGAANSTMDFDPADVASLPERGLGLPIINRVMDRVGYRRDGVHNILVLTRRFGAHPR
jgi:serine/threonine-protein kinase RsbW